MKKSDLYFTQRRTFIFSDVCLTHCSPRESHSSDWSHHLCALPKIAADSGRSLSCDTQLNCRTLFIKDDALLSSPCFRFLCGLFFNLPVRNKALCAKFTTRFRLKELTFERVPILTKWFSASASVSVYPPVGHSGSLSTVNETNCNKKKTNLKNSHELISNSCSTTMCLKRDAIYCIVLEK